MARPRTSPASTTRLAAVLTGDVVASRAFPDRGGLPQVLREAFDAVAGHEGSVLRPFEIYRGDSFQGVVRPDRALLAATVIRARLRFSSKDKRSVVQLPDARVAIGLGTITYSGDRVVESDGMAFQLSGRALDESPRSSRLLVWTDWPGLDPAMLDVIAKALDSIIQRWHATSAEVVFRLLVNESATQQQLADDLAITQSAVSQRLKRAEVQTVRMLLDHYERLLGLNAGA